MQLELQLGAVNIFITPRQLHALIQLSNTFLVESTKQRSAEQQLDIENDNDQTSEYKAFNAMSGNLGLNQCWSTDPLGITFHLDCAQVASKAQNSESFR